MSGWFKKFNAWHKTRAGYAFWGLVELGLAYMLASLAIDDGSLLHYLLAILLFIGAVQNFVKLGQALLKRNEK